MAKLPDYTQNKHILSIWDNKKGVIYLPSSLIPDNEAVTIKNSIIDTIGPKNLRSTKSSRAPDCSIMQRKKKQIAISCLYDMLLDLLENGEREIYPKNKNK